MKNIQNSFNPEKYYKLLVDGLANFFKDPKHEIHVCVGLSGGIDSALVAKIAVDAFGPKRVHGLILPSNTTSEESVDLALKLAYNLGIQTHGIPIGKIADDFASNFEKNMNANINPIARGNISARMRMMALMCASNNFGWAVLNTGNRTEAMLGYCTLYGDTAGAFSPIGDLYKTEVFEICRYLNDKAAEKGDSVPIPDAIITRPPTAELIEGQTDEGEIGASYAVIDDILWKLFSQDMTKDEAKQAGMDVQLCEKLGSLYVQNEFKRQYLPPHTILHAELAPADVQEKMKKNG